jgi:hypothetical protein
MIFCRGKRQLVSQGFWENLGGSVSMKFLFAAFFAQILLFQNCGPVSFKMMTQASVTKKPIPEGPLANCDSFQVERNSVWVVPFGQRSVPVTLSGQIGESQGPLSWDIQPGSGNPLVGNSVQLNLGVGRFTATARSIDNLCSESFSFDVVEGLCETPSASTIQFASITNPIVEGEPATFEISNFENLRDVKVTWENGRLQPISTKRFVNTFARAGSYDIVIDAKDRFCGNDLRITRRVLVDSYVCVPEITSLMPSVLTVPAHAESPTQFQLGVPLNKLYQGKFNVNFGNGNSSDYFASPFSYTYPAVASPTNYVVTFKAKDAKCQMDIQQSINLRVEPKVCVPSVTDIAVQVIPDPANIYNTDQVSFTVVNASAFTQFQWNLGNQTSGSGTMIPNTQYSVPVDQDEKLYTAVFSGKGPQTCNVQLNKSINLNVKLRKYESNFVVSESTVKPPVRLFFIVDNSETMLTEQNTLRAGFQQMFSGASLDALKMFDTEVFLFNTSQYSQRIGADADLESLLLSSSVNTIANSTSFLGLNSTQSVAGDNLTYRRARVPVGSDSSSTLFGRIPGDVMGYRNSSAVAGTKNYVPAPVSQFYANSGGANLRPTIVSESLYLAANSNATQTQTFINDFHSRVAVLDPNKHSQSAYGEYTKRESAGCAISRILSDPRYQSNTHQSAFVILSDEDENDGSSLNCIKSSGSVTRVWGSCGVPGTDFQYSIAENCQITKPNYYQGSYSAKVTYITYRRCSATSDTGQCIAYDYLNQMRLGHPPAGMSCLDYSGFPADQEPNCTATERGYSLVRTLDSNPQAPPFNCDSSYVPTNHRPYYVDGSCRITSFNSSTETIALAPPANQCSDYFANYPICVSNPSLCSSIQYTEHANFQVPENNLSCDSPCLEGFCPVGMTYNQHIMNNLGGRSCEARHGIPVATGPRMLFEANDPNKCPGEVFIQDYSSPPETALTTTYVNSNNGTTRIAYKDFIKSKFDATQSATGLRPTLMTFTYKTNPPASDVGAGIGTRYMELADHLGYSNFKNSINVADYSPALTQLSNFISTTLNRVFMLNLNPGQVLRKVYFKRGSQAEVEVIAGFSVVAGKLIINEMITVTGGQQISVMNLDSFRATYW